MALTLFLALTQGSSAQQAGGFNVDSLVTFSPLSSTYRTMTDTTGCPAGCVGRFTFTARLTNKTTSPAIPGLNVHVQTLTNGNVLLDPQTNALLGGAGAVMEIPQVGQYADGLLSASETVDVPFVVCLKTRQSFQFFVNVLGIVTKLVSVNRAGTHGGNDQSFEPVLSADGRVIAFRSIASDLVVKDTNGTSDVFVRDLKAGTTKLVSINRAGTDSGNGASAALNPNSPRDSGGNLALSADGRFVAFESYASDLVANDNNGQGDVFVRDLKTGTTKLVSINLAGTNSGNGDSVSDVGGGGLGGPVLSADGRFVAFSSPASDLVANDNNGNEDVFVRDLGTGTTMLVSVNQAGTSNGSAGYGHELSANGRFIGFVSYASDLVATPILGVPNLFVRDLQTGTTTLVSVSQAGTGSGNGASYIQSRPSADGRFVVFVSMASNLVANDNNGTWDVFVRDLQTGTTSLVSVNQAGTNSGNGFSYGHELSADGRFVAFESTASNLVANDNNGTWDVFVRDLQMGTTTLVSVNRAGTDSGHNKSLHVSLSADGRFVGFFSEADDLALDTHGTGNAFVRDLQTGTTTLMSVNRFGFEGGNHFSGAAVLSADGRFAAFLSAASDLVTTDTSGQDDVFVRPVQ